MWVWNRLLREQEQHRHSKNLLVQNEKLAQIGQLVAAVGHEIANPIQLSTNSSAALDAKVKEVEAYLDPLLSQEDEAAKQFVLELTAKMKQIHQINQHHRIAIDKLTDISSSLRTQSRQEDHPTSDVELNEVVKDSLLLVGGRTKLFEVRCDLGELTRVTCYRSRIGQVVTNLLANAADAVNTKLEQHLTKNEGYDGRMIVTTELSHHQGTPGVLISVADNGDGVPEAIRTRIFEQFYTTKEAGKGTGLGLSLCKDIVTEHGGELTVTNDPELGGARFELWLPLELTEQKVA